MKYSAEKTQVEQLLNVPVTLIPNGVPIPQQCAPLLPKATLVIGTAARISPQKRFEDLIEAFRLVHERLPEYELQIAGGVERGAEEYFQELRSQAADLPIQWIGELLDTQPFLMQLDMFVMISEPAGCPNASLEAMAVGLPIVATDFGGASEQIIDQLNGLLVPNRNPAAFGAAIIALATDLASRQRFGRASRRRAREMFSIERMTDDYLNLMQLR
ncbi:MAG: glycosyltransferase family 4 protein [Pirellulales bacterium]